MKIVRWSPADMRSRLNEAMALYAEAMQYPPETGHHRAGFAVAHTRRAGFRSMAALDTPEDRSAAGWADPDRPGSDRAPRDWSAAGWRAGDRAARDGTGSDGQLIGFAYGYATAPGQWWHDQVRAALTPARAAEWLTGCFELSELHVRPAFQGRGIGRALLTALVDDLPQRTVLLSTPEGDTRAWRLYRAVGFVDLVRHHLFPGDSRPFAVLGVRLPLAARTDGRGQRRTGSMPAEGPRP